MAASDVFVVKEYYRVKSGGGYVLLSSVTFTDAQVPALVKLLLQPNLYGFKLTIQRTAGTDRSVDYEMWSGD